MQLMMLIGVVVAFAVGVAVRTLEPVSLSVVLWLLLISLGVGLIWRRKSFSSTAPYLLGVSLCLTFVSLGIMRTEVASWQFGVSPLQSELEQKVELTGIVVREPDFRESTVHLYTQVEDDLVLVTTNRQTAVEYGDEIVFSGKLTVPQGFETDLGRTFNYPGYLQARGVEYTISFADVTVTQSNQANWLVAQLLRAKENFIHSLERIIPEPEVGLGEGLLLGVKSALGDDIESDFRRTGIIHIVVLSGYNVMLVVAFILFVFSWFLPFRLRVIAGVVAIVAFALIVGLSATVVRASIMASLLLVAQAWGRRYDVLRALLLAGTVMIAINPYLLLYDIGFQLSFMATLGLLLVAPQFESIAVRAPTTFGLRDFLVATVATQITVLPLLLYHIGEVSLIAVVVNVLVLPIVPVAMLLTFFTGVLGFFSVTLASLAGVVAALTLKYILLVAQLFASLPIATMTVPTFSALGVVGLYGLYALVYVIMKNRNSKTSELNGWIIEDEEQLQKRTTPNGAATANSIEIPKMFR